MCRIIDCSHQQVSLMLPSVVFYTNVKSGLKLGSIFCSSKLSFIWFIILSTAISVVFGVWQKSLCLTVYLYSNQKSPKEYDYWFISCKKILTYWKTIINLHLACDLTCIYFYPDWVLPICSVWQSVFLHLVSVWSRWQTLMSLVCLYQTSLGLWMELNTW